MVDRIPSSSPPPQASESNRAVTTGRSESTVAESQVGSSSTTDTVTVGETARQVQQSTDTLSELPVVDAKRVEEIKQAIIDGSLQINADRVAEKMMQLESNLVG